MNRVKRDQSGLGMIEILVALVLLSMGLLGMAAMQMTSTKMTAQAQYKTQALLLAQDMVERVRANRNNAQNSPGSYSINMDGSETCETDFTPGGSNVATNDTQEWVNSVRCLLPDGQGTVAVSTTPDTVNMTLSWETRMAEDDDAFIENQDTLAMTARF